MTPINSRLNNMSRILVDRLHFEPCARVLVSHTAAVRRFIIKCTEGCFNMTRVAPAINA